MNPKVFISYSWDNKDHQAWVRELATFLRANGIDASLDQFDVPPGGSFTEFMERGVSEADYVLVVCTPGFARKSNARKGGVGYEQQIVSGRLVNGAPREKFIPILRAGDYGSAIPTHFLGVNTIDLRGAIFTDAKKQELLRALYAAPLHRSPPLGPSPDFVAPNQGNIAPDRLTAGELCDIIKAGHGEAFDKILGGRVSAAAIDNLVASERDKVHEILQVIEDSRGYTWNEMLAAHLAKTTGDPSSESLEIGFRGGQSWGAQTNAIAWLRFCPDSAKSNIEAKIKNRGSLQPDPENMDNLRLVISAMGFMGAWWVLDSFRDRMGILKDDYVNEKLGPYLVQAYLVCFIYHGHKWMPHNVIKSMIETFQATNARGHIYLSEFDFFDHFQPMGPGQCRVLFDNVCSTEYNVLIEPLLWQLERVPNPHLASPLLNYASRAGDRLCRLALEAAAYIRSPTVLAAIKASYANGQQESSQALAVAIGVNRSHEDFDHLNKIRESASPRSNLLHAATWSLGELASDGLESAGPALQEGTLHPDDDVCRGLSWLGLAKSKGTDKDAMRSGLQDAMSSATTFVETLILGIAGALSGDLTLVAKGIHAAELNHAPVWRLESRVYNDLRGALRRNCGAQGRFLNSLLDYGCISI